jgi:hypothetical protein
MTTHKVAIGLAVAAASIAPTAALAKDGDVRRAGSCTKGSAAKIKLSPENGRIETEFEVDQNRSGVRWRVVVRRNGKVVTSTKATTGGRSGSFTVRRLLGNGTISARATSPSGEVCTASASI